MYINTYVNTYVYIKHINVFFSTFIFFFCNFYRRHVGWVNACSLLSNLLCILQFDNYLKLFLFGPHFGTGSSSFSLSMRELLLPLNIYIIDGIVFHIFMQISSCRFPVFSSEICRRAFIHFYLLVHCNANGMQTINWQL